MIRAWKIGIGMAVLAILLAGQSARAAEQAGYVLVDKLVTLFNQMANSPDVSYDQINSASSEMMVMARQAKAEQRVDQQFFDRYSRILRLIKLVIIEDKAEILRPISGPECAAFTIFQTRFRRGGDADLVQGSGTPSNRSRIGKGSGSRTRWQASKAIFYQSGVARFYADLQINFLYAHPLAASELDC